MIEDAKQLILEHEMFEEGIRKLAVAGVGILVAAGLAWIHKSRKEFEFYYGELKNDFLRLTTELYAALELLETQSHDMNGIPDWDLSEMTRKGKFIYDHYYGKKDKKSTNTLLNFDIQFLTDGSDIAFKHRLINQQTKKEAHILAAKLKTRLSAMNKANDWK